MSFFSGTNKMKKINKYFHQPETHQNDRPVIVAWDGVAQCKPWLLMSLVVVNWLSCFPSPLHTFVSVCSLSRQSCQRGLEPATFYTPCSGFYHTELFLQTEPRILVSGRWIQFFIFFFIIKAIETILPLGHYLIPPHPPPPKQNTSVTLFESSLFTAGM